jgi:hypothetical protein
VPETDTVDRKKSVDDASLKRVPLVKICTEWNGLVISEEYPVGVDSSETNIESRVVVTVNVYGSVVVI